MNGSARSLSGGPEPADLYIRAIEQCPASVVITDSRGLIEYVNARFTEVTGYRLDEVLGENPRILKSGQMTDETYSEMWSAIRAGGTWAGRMHNRRKDGSLFWEQAVISGLLDGRGQVSHFIAV